MNIAKVERVSMFYITTDEGVVYKRIPDGKSMDDDLWFLVNNDFETRIYNHETRRQLKKALVNYVEEMIDASCY